MNKFKTALSAVAMSTLIAPAAMAATILIDDFADAAPQIVADDPFMGVGDGSEVAAAVLGGFRDLYVETSPAAALGTQLGVQNGDLSFNNGSGQTGLGQVVYDGGDGSPTTAADVDTMGLGGVDLTGGGTNDKFFFEVIDADFDFVFRATVWDMVGNVHTFSENIFSGSFDPFLALSEFTSNGVDVMNVGALVFEVESTATASAVDGRLGSISVVPLPASALLLLGGLGGFAGVSATAKRRRRKA